MQTVTSADGTEIAYDRSGEGPAVILVGGALSYRKFKKFEQIAAALSEHCYGAKTVGGLKHASRSLAEVLPNATLTEVPGQNHNVAAGVMVPLLADFVTGSFAVAT